MVTLTNQADLQKIPISFKHRGQLVPDNIDGHLNIQVPISAIGQLIQNIRGEHESNKKKRGKITFSSISTKKCLDNCKMKNTGHFDCHVDASYYTREQCQRYEDKDLVKMENLQIEKLEHKYESMKRNLALKNQQLEDERKKRQAIAAIIFGILGIYTSLTTGLNAYKNPQISCKNPNFTRR